MAKNTVVAGEREKFWYVGSLGLNNVSKGERY